jgi:hypothetical protein
MKNIGTPLNEVARRPAGHQLRPVPAGFSQALAGAAAAAEATHWGKLWDSARSPKTFLGTVYKWITCCCCSTIFFPSFFSPETQRNVLHVRDVVFFLF